MVRARLDFCLIDKTLGCRIAGTHVMFAIARPTNKQLLLFIFVTQRAKFACSYVRTVHIEIASALV